MRDKEVFKFKELNTDKLALSLGLATAPQIGFVKKSELKNVQRTNNDEEDDEDIEEPINEDAVPSKKLSRL